MKWNILLLLLLVANTGIKAQHHHHIKSDSSGTDTIPAMHEDMSHGTDSSRMHMSHAFSRNLPMTRNGSGTSWLPDNSPMYGYMFHAGEWMFMAHGDLYLRYTNQDVFNSGSRGGERFDAPNMFMLMGQRNIGKKGLFHFNTMLSLDPLTVGGEGYPLLFQTGETYKGEPLVDRQHPHDFISELSVSYAHALNANSDLFIYLAYPGEPALGPSAYVHRPSGFFNPDAPLTHHWVDATHITFGVASLGYRIGKLKFESSVFTGREPGENRYNFDPVSPDSWSGRISYNPGPEWAMQVSHGFIKEPESLHPGLDVNRTTASLSYSKKNQKGVSNNITALWGMNKPSHHAAEHGVLIEGSRIYKRVTGYGRLEWVQKSLEELVLDENTYGHDAVFPVQALTAGLIYELTKGKIKLAPGFQISAFRSDKRLHELYGSLPLSAQLFIRIYPSQMNR